MYFEKSILSLSTIFKLQDGTQLPSIPFISCPKELIELHKCVDENLAKGFIQHSTFSIGAPILFVVKKDDSVCTCIDCGISHLRAWSGMMVQDPQKGNQVDELFVQARRMAAQEGPLEPSKSGRPTFMGMGRTLSGEPSQHGSDTVPAGPPRTPDPIIRNITFWRNGFTVDDGQLRRLDDPANAQFLMSISRSEYPKELEPADRGTPVHVNLIRRSEDWMLLATRELW